MVTKGNHVSAKFAQINGIAPGTNPGARGGGGGPAWLIMHEHTLF